MISLYLIEDDRIKVDYFERILKIINQHEAFQCQSGFGEKDIHTAYLSFDLINEAIQNQDGFWLLDISLPASIKTAKKLTKKYIGEKEELKKQVHQLLDVFGGHRDDTYLACVLSVILRNKNRPFNYISTARALSFPEVRDILDFTQRNNIRYPDQPYLDDDRLKPAAREIVAFIRDNKQDRPEQVFLDEVFKFTMHDLHISEQIAQQQQINPRILEPIQALSNFLAYSSLKDFNHDFSLWKNYEDMRSYTSNLVEESLKSIISKNASLFNLFIWAWGAFRAMNVFRSEDQQKGGDIFRTALKQTINQYKDTKRAKNRISQEWDYFVRHGAVWAEKPEKGYREALSAYSEMLQVLFYNPETKKVNLKRIETSSRELKFFLEIDGDRLIQRLNTVHNDLLGVFIGSNFHDQHQTSQKILRYWLLSQVSYRNEDEKSVAGKKRWGTDSGFHIENRNNKQNETIGITLIFSL